MDVEADASETNKALYQSQRTYCRTVRRVYERTKYPSHITKAIHSGKIVIVPSNVKHSLTKNIHQILPHQACILPCLRFDNKKVFPGVKPLTFLFCQFNIK